MCKIGNIRIAKEKDISRIAEILVFTKRMNYRRIFQNDVYSFGELQVLRVSKEYTNNSTILNNTYIFEEDFVKGIMEIEGKEITKLYVDSFFSNQGIGGKLIEFAIEKFNVQFLWVLEKNDRAIEFYNSYGFFEKGEWKYEEGTVERLKKLER